MIAESLMRGLILGALLHAGAVTTVSVLRRAGVSCPDTPTDQEYEIISLMIGETIEGFERGSTGFLDTVSVNSAPGGLTDEWLATFRDLRGADRDFRCRNRDQATFAPQNVAIRPSATIVVAGAGSGPYSMNRIRIGLSRVGFSPDGMRAVVYVEHSCGSLCAGGGIVSLRRDASRQWRVLRRQWTWVS